MNKSIIGKAILSLEAKSTKITESGCWIWMCGEDKDGYGQFSLQNKNIRAHRASWMVHVGDIPQGMCVMHRCDIPACINPHHLRLGTNAENTKDKMDKGRHRPASGDAHYLRRKPDARAGDKSPSAKLSSAQTEQVKKLLGVKPQTEIAKMFGVSRTCISAISTGRNWKHLPKQQAKE